VARGGFGYVVANEFCSASKNALQASVNSKFNINHLRMAVLATNPFLLPR
jgi:hypothetical protein